MKKVEMREEYVILDTSSKAVRLDGNPFTTLHQAQTNLAKLDPGEYHILAIHVGKVSLPKESAEGATVLANTQNSVVDGEGVAWTITPQKQVAADGVVDKTTGGQGGVVQLAYSDHVVYSQTAQGTWQHRVGGKWVPPEGTEDSPFVKKLDEPPKVDGNPKPSGDGLTPGKTTAPGAPSGTTAPTAAPINPKPNTP